jgi:predicted ester cyclase
MVFDSQERGDALMSAEENKALIRRYFEALSGQDKPANIVNIYVADEQLKEHIAVFEEGFPRYQLTADDLIAEADKVAVRATFTGTHKGELMNITPTGKQVTVSLMLLYRIADGKIVDHWMVADQLGLMQQLGVAAMS